MGKGNKYSFCTLSYCLQPFCIELEDWKKYRHFLYFFQFFQHKYRTRKGDLALEYSEYMEVRDEKMYVPGPSPGRAR